MGLRGQPSLFSKFAPQINIHVNEASVQANTCCTAVCDIPDSNQDFLWAQLSFGRHYLKVGFGGLAVQAVDRD